MSASGKVTVDHLQMRNGLQMTNDSGEVLQSISQVSLSAYKYQLSGELG